jgi:DNA-binding IclR family transcriptional regulator
MTTARDRPPEEAAEDTSFARGLRVLLTIADRGEIRADDLGTALDMSMSTVYRYLRTLTEFGFIERHEGGYGLGPRLLIGTGANVSSEELIRVADPFLRLLAEETGETAVISRRIGLTAVCLHEIPSANALPRRRPRRPLDQGARPGAAGHARPVATRSSGVPAAAPPADVRQRDDLREIATDGIARSAGEFISGSVAIAVPIIRDGIVARRRVGPRADSRGAARARRPQPRAIVGHSPSAASLTAMRLSYVGWYIRVPKRGAAPAMDILHLSPSRTPARASRSERRSTGPSRAAPAPAVVHGPSARSAERDGARLSMYASSPTRRPPRRPASSTTSRARRPGWGLPVVLPLGGPCGHPGAAAGRPRQAVGLLEGGTSRTGGFLRVRPP